MKFLQKYLCLDYTRTQVKNFFLYNQIPLQNSVTGSSQDLVLLLQTHAINSGLLEENDDSKITNMKDHKIVSQKLETT